MEEKIYQKKDYVYVETLGVCRVDEVTNLVQKDGTILPYYGLRSMRTPTKTAYYPIENHEVNIRDLISLETAKEKIESFTEDTPVDEKYEAMFVVELANKSKKKAKK